MILYHVIMFTKHSITIFSFFSGEFLPIAIIIILLLLPPFIPFLPFNSSFHWTNVQLFNVVMMFEWWAKLKHPLTSRWIINKFSFHLLWPYLLKLNLISGKIPVNPLSSLFISRDSRKKMIISTIFISFHQKL